MSLSRIILSTFLFFGILNQSAQTVTNGNFNSGTTGWGCAAETGAETTYGGSNGANTIAEVDDLASLCQTLSGFVPGNVYYIAFDASRRTGGCPSPAATNININVSGGVLSTTVTRTNTTFGFATFGFLFTANSTSHGFTISPGSGFSGITCGMIVDNIVVAASSLPIELTYFSGIPDNGIVNLLWQTATEKNNKHFEIEKSKNGVDYQTILFIPSKGKYGTSSSRLNYEATDPDPLTGTIYYRLKQVDYDGQFSLSKIISITYKKQDPECVIYPNPNSGIFSILLSGTKKNVPVHVQIYNSPGNLIYSKIISPVNNSETLEVNPEKPLSPGYYTLYLSWPDFKLHKKLVVK